MGIDRETADRTILNLSDGDQQRVGIARALSHNPNIIIADESIGDLDRDTKEEILKFFIVPGPMRLASVLLCYYCHHSKKVSDTADVIYGIRDGQMSVIRPKSSQYFDWRKKHAAGYHHTRYHHTGYHQ
ncbi:MAG: ATP-binding cassette domain-containing protein [Peptococcaceae bacterium]|nr:ATP-binding cassette domain-containing protein [Peptococcaceae bacterium]